MKKIAAFENKDIGAAQKTINYNMYWAYRNSVEAKNETLNFDEVIWESDIEPIITTCKENGIDRITISSRTSGMVKIICEFVKLGCTIDGTTEVKTIYTDITTGLPEIVPAIVIKIN